MNEVAEAARAAPCPPEPTEAAPLPESEEDLLARALRREKHAVARLVSLFEDRRLPAAATRARIMEALRARSEARRGTLVGITGAPGSGKSSLLARLTLALLASPGDLTVAVLAIDPSSHVSKGAFLGDRTRMKLPAGEKRLYFRSQAAATDLGGLGPASFHVCRLLAELFDCVLVETVGIGQSEIDIRHLAERVFLVLSPLGGDDVQFLKAGIMEVPHAFVLNKCDEPTAQKSYHQLRSSLWLARPFDADEVPVYRTSAKTGEGIAALTEAIAGALGKGSVEVIKAKEAHFFSKWVQGEWGRVGAGFLERSLGGAAAFLETTAGFDRAPPAFDGALRASLRADAPNLHSNPWC